LAVAAHREGAERGGCWRPARAGRRTAGRSVAPALWLGTCALIGACVQGHEGGATDRGGSSLGRGVEQVGDGALATASTTASATVPRSAGGGAGSGESGVPQGSAPDRAGHPVSVASAQLGGGLAQAAGASPQTTLRAAEPGSAPQLDPDAVYIVGWTPELGDNSTALAIAAVDAPEDSVGAVGYFSHGWIRRSDGHLLYQDNNYGDPMRELLRDALPIAPYTSDGPSYHQGETSFASNLPCEPSETQQTTQRRYLVAWDGSYYHSCNWQDAVPSPADTNTEAWYDAAGALAYEGAVWPQRIGAQRRLLGQRDSALVGIDLDSGAELANIDLEGRWISAVRMRADGFSVALRTPPDYATAAVSPSGAALPPDERTWLDLDLSGAILARGSYAPLPAALSYVNTGNPWGNGAAALDGAGRLYEFAGDQDGNVVVVRRPRGEGEGEVAYRYPLDADPVASPTLLRIEETYFITGG